MALVGNSRSVGHFLKFEHWQDALKLLHFQIAQRKSNKHYNTLSMFYFERLSQPEILLAPEDYFTANVSNNLFYALEQFGTFPYLMPKGTVSGRSYVFLTYPMRVLHNAIGIYLRVLSAEFLKEYFGAATHIQSYYGADLTLDSDRLIVNAKNIYYFNYYKRFRAGIRKEVSEDTEHKIVIKIDIQNYFDEISIPRLLQLLDRWVKPSQKIRMSFDLTAIEQISSFFEFLGWGRRGIPQSDNDVISSFVGYLYLVFGDLFIDDIIRTKLDCVASHSIRRYVDDTYVCIRFKDGTSVKDRELAAHDLAALTADRLYYELGLRLNSKTRLFWLNDDQDRAEILKSLKKISPGYYVDSDEEENPENKIKNIIHELEALKSSTINACLRPDNPLQDEIFKEVFDKSVSQLLGKPENKERLKEIFDQFDFNLVKVSPLEIIILITRVPEAEQAFRQFLLGKLYLCTADVDLILKYLCQTEFKDLELIAKLRNESGISDIIRVYDYAKISSGFRHYLQISESQCSVISAMPEVIEQIRLRTLCENNKSFSVALNHLANEVAAVCRSKERSNKANYDAQDVLRFIMSNRVPHEVCVRIRNLFDRRNMNQVSHPGTETTAALGVSEEEYHEYRHYVGRCLECIL